MPTRALILRAVASLSAGLALAACNASSGGTDGPSQSRLPLSFAVVSASRQTGRADQPVGSSPVVRVLDALGEPVQGVEVSFTATGGGSATPVTTATGVDGLARTTWRLGAAGPQSLQATAAGIGGSVDFSAEVLTSSGYNIDLRLLTTASDAQWEAFTAAARRIAEVVVGDLPPLDLTGGASCEGDTVSGSVENLLILVRIHSIDGAGGILGQAGPCVIRSSSRLPAVGLMELDAADLDRLGDQGKLGSVVLHEMMHVVGFGTVWNAYARRPLASLVSGEGTLGSAFTGAQALAEAKAWNGAPASWTSVPLENCGAASPKPCGSGTQDSHWREPVFEDELMTGWLSGASQPLSRTTIGALADMGYVVDAGAADLFDLATAALRGEAVATQEPGEYVGDDVLHLPVTEVP